MPIDIELLRSEEGIAQVKEWQRQRHSCSSSNNNCNLVMIKVVDEIVDLDQRWRAFKYKVDGLKYQKRCQSKKKMMMQTTTTPSSSRDTNNNDGKNNNNHHNSGSSNNLDLKELSEDIQRLEKEVDRLKIQLDSLLPCIGNAVIDAPFFKEADPHNNNNSYDNEAISKTNDEETGMVVDAFWCIGGYEKKTKSGHSFAVLTRTGSDLYSALKTLAVKRLTDWFEAQSYNNGDSTTTEMQLNDASSSWDTLHLVSPISKSQVEGIVGDCLSNSNRVMNRSSVSSTADHGYTASSCRTNSNMSVVSSAILTALYHEGEAIAEKQLPLKYCCYAYNQLKWVVDDPDVSTTTTNDKKKKKKAAAVLLSSRIYPPPHNNNNLDLNLLEGVDGTILCEPNTRKCIALQNDLANLSLDYLLSIGIRCRGVICDKLLTFESRRVNIEVFFNKQWYSAGYVGYSEDFLTRACRVRYGVKKMNDIDRSFVHLVHVVLFTPSVILPCFCESNSGVNGVILPNNNLLKDRSSLLHEEPCTTNEIKFTRKQVKKGNKIKVVEKLNNNNISPQNARSVRSTSTSTQPFGRHMAIANPTSEQIKAELQMSEMGFIYGMNG